jgi:hypothetical protein
MGTGFFPGVRCGRGVTLTPHPLLVPRLKIEYSYTSTLPKGLRGLWKGETYILLLSCNFNQFCNFSKIERLRLPEDDAGALKHVRVLTIYKILLINICCAFVGLDNELYKMHGTYIKTIWYRCNRIQTQNCTCKLQ